MQEDILFPLDRLELPAPGLPQSHGKSDNSDDFELVVVFTSFEATLSALRQVRPLVTGLGARVSLLVLQVVPYPLALERPPVAIEFIRESLRHLASQSPLEMATNHYLCRDGLEALTRALKPASVVVVGGSKSWCRPTKEQKLARKLRQHDHSVLFLPTR